MLKLPSHHGECSHWLEKVGATLGDYQKSFIERSTLVASLPPIGYFGKTVQRVYRLTKVGGYHSWMLQCLHDKPTFETRGNDFNVIINYLDPNEWTPYRFTSETEFSRAFIEFMDQSGSSDYPCQRDLNTSLINFVAEMVERSQKSYASQQWLHSLSATITEHSIGPHGRALFDAMGGRTFGEVTLADYIKLLPFHYLLYLKGFGQKLYHALRTDVERERIPWPLHSGT